MSNLRSTIEGLAEQFAVSIIQALRGASIEEVYEVSGVPGASRGPGRPRSAAAAPSAAPAAPRAPRAISRVSRDGRLGRRTAGAIGEMVEAIVDVLAKAEAGLRAEQIRDALGVQSKELPRPLTEALTTGRITKTGQKRATTYFAAGAKRGGRPAKK